MSCEFKAMEKIQRPIMSVSVANDGGKAVWFTPASSGVARAEDSKYRVGGDWMPLERKNGIFEMPFEPEPLKQTNLFVKVLLQ